VRVPAAVGLKVTLTVQNALTAKVLVQVVVFEKSPAAVPRIAICQMCIVTPAVFVIVAFRGLLLVPTVWLGKVSVAGDTVAAVATPVRRTVCGLPAALSLTLKSDFRGPEAVGSKEMLKVQLLPAARVLVQFELRLKSPELPPAMVGVDSERAALPVLVRVTVWEELVVPTGSCPKNTAGGERLTAGAGRMPSAFTKL